MSGRSFAALMDRLARTPEWKAEHAGVAFLAQVNERMRASGMSNSALAQRVGASPGYITQVFRGDVDLSLNTMVKLAQAVDGTVQVNLIDDGRAPS